MTIESPVMTTRVTADDAIAFVRERGIVLASAKGSAPSLAEFVAGRPIRGSWWADPRSRDIYAILTAVARSDQVLVCRLAKGKITLVHRRLWPSLVRLAGRFEPHRIARVREEHTVSGRHVSHSIDFPKWVPPSVAEEARSLGEDEAVASFGTWLAEAETSLKGRRSS